VSKRSFAFGPVWKRHNIPSAILPRRLNGLLGALAGAVLLAAFVAIAFAVIDRSPSPTNKSADRGAGERHPVRAIGSSSRPKNDFRPAAAAASHDQQSIPTAVPVARSLPAQARAAAVAIPETAPAPVTSPIAERFPGASPAGQAERASQPPPAPPLRAEITATASARADRPAEVRSDDDAGWPRVPQEARRKATAAGSPDAPTDCLPQALQNVLQALQVRFGQVTVVSTTHLQSDNHSRGSTRDKLHQACKAVDIRAAGDTREIMAFLKSRPEVGGINSYRNRLVHFDLNSSYKSNDQADAATAGRRARR
jgi:hypothetical protein